MLQDISAETAAKRSALLLMLCERNKTYSKLREKNRAFQVWKNFLVKSETMSVQFELARLSQEVEQLVYGEQLLVANFAVQKAEMDSKLVELATLMTADAEE